MEKVQKNKHKFLDHIAKRSVMMTMDAIMNTTQITKKTQHTSDITCYK